MKQFISVLFLCAVSLTTSLAQSKTETIVIKTAIYCDHSLRCESSAPKINESLRRNAKGIKKVKVNPEANTITVTYDGRKTNPDQIRKVLSETGFDADQVKALPEAYAKLDGCCKA